MRDGWLLTTSVGSLPKPEALKRARVEYERGRLSATQLEALERQVTQEAIRKQEALGIDILVDGEYYRGDMATYFAEHLDGFKMSGLVRSYGNRYYRKPRVVGPIVRRAPMTVTWFQFAQGLTTKPVKGMLTGPYTIMDWSFNEHYRTRRDLALALAAVIHDEAVDLERAGARYIQIDEPALSTRPEEMPVAIDAMRIVTNGLKAKTITHICYGDFEKIYPQMLDLPIDQIDLEFANGGFALLDVLKRHPFTKEVAVGVVDVHSHRIESQAEVEANIRKALTVFRPEQVVVDPDCGLKTRTVEEAWQKLEVIVKARNKVREELAHVAGPSARRS